MSWSRIRTVATVLAALGAMLVVAACGSSGGTDTEAAGDAAGEEATQPQSGDGIVVGHVNPHLSNPTLQALKLGQERAAQALGWKVRTLDADLTPDKQVTSLDTLVNLDVGAITSWTLDPGAVEAAYQRASEADIPIVGFNSESDFINTNVKTELSSTCTPFQAQAAYIAERIPGAKVIVIGPPPVPALITRVKCFQAAAGKEGLTVLERQDNLKDTAQRSQELMQNLLTKHGDVQAIWAYNDPSALGASAALKAGGRQVWSGDTKGIVVIGNNADVDAIEAIKAGALTLTYDENTFQAGVEAIKALAPVLRDDESASSLPEQVVVESAPYDAGNVGDWKPAEQRRAQMDG
jgi:ribose transport system substrate-binding protein